MGAGAVKQQFNGSIARGSSGQAKQWQDDDDDDCCCCTIAAAGADTDSTVCVPNPAGGLAANIFSRFTVRVSGATEATTTANAITGPYSGQKYTLVQPFWTGKSHCVIQDLTDSGAPNGFTSEPTIQINRYPTGILNPPVVESATAFVALRFYTRLGQTRVGLVAAVGLPLDGVFWFFSGGLPGSPSEPPIVPSGICYDPGVTYSGLNMFTTPVSSPENSTFAWGGTFTATACCEEEDI